MGPAPAAGQLAGAHAALAALAIAALAVLTPACSSSQERRDQTAPNPAPESGGPDDPGDDPGAGNEPSSAPPGPPVTEAVARALLARRFRAAGWRIRSDVRVTDPGDPDFAVTVDGYDPESRIGFEYIDPSETGSDLSATERAALASNSTHRILIIDPAGSERVIELADQFLQSLGAR